MLAHLGEVEARELHLAAACSSMFAYCVEVLGLDEGAAYTRIRVARLGRRFPVVLDALAGGRIHLSAARLLAPHMTERNHLDLLEAAEGKTKRAVELLVASLAPKPDAPSRVRRLPVRGRPSGGQPRLLGSDADPGRPPGPARAPAKPPAPLAAGRFKVQFTASAALVGKLEELQALLSHREAGRDLALVIEQAVDLLRNKLVKERFGQGAHRRRRRQPTSKEAGPHEAQAERTRHVPREIRRQVVERDEHQCAYVDPDSGRRCSERRFLELQHHQPYGRGGRHSVDNISLFCRAHNQFQARRDYGGARIDAAVAARRTASWSRDQSPPLQLDLVGGEP